MADLGLEVGNVPGVQTMSIFLESSFSSDRIAGDVDLHLDAGLIGTSTAAVGRRKA